jgi:ubiquinone/menaquinone biosynthesis C-methylase UbiE
MLPKARYARVLEIGTGTGFFILNLWQAGFVGEPHACDISPGMLAVCAENARRIGCDIRLRTADAEGLPHEDGSFDLVVGHALLHHLPEPETALREVRRVLAPGGEVLIAGEPTPIGDRLAGSARWVARRGVRAAAAVAPRLRKRRPPGPATVTATAEDRILRELEFQVDLHTFAPGELAAMARRAGFDGVRVETEELLSSLFGWAVRTVEADAPPGLLGRPWAWWAYRWYLRLYAVDRALLNPALPKSLFHNALLYGEKRG